MRQLHVLAALALSALLGACASTTPERGSVQRLAPEDLARLAPAPNPKLPLDQVVALSRGGSPPAAIIEQLRATGTFYNLTPEQIVGLSKQGVDQSVINYLVDAQERARQATLITQLADRDAQAARQLEAERQRRLQAQRRYDPFFYDPFWPRPYYGWNHRGGWNWGIHGGIGPYWRRW
ncbi:MAG: hypothetical protein JNM79_08810 [Burkholderiales bacterium]|nr:hypothetical protein [Burkholderiales bacterium]